jgi:endonuclease G
LDYTAPEVKAIAFVLPNEKGEQQLSAYNVTIDYVEHITGIDFFPDLPDDLEVLLESRNDLSRWQFKPLNFSNNHKAATSEQCRARASSTGERCRNRTKNKNGYCHAHHSQVPGAVISNKPGKNATAMRCSATTLSGTRCKRQTKNASGRCWQHP